MRARSSQMRMANWRWPRMRTSATPVMFWTRSEMKRSAKSVSSSGEWRLLVSDRYITGWASASTLAMIGSSISSGMRPRTRLTRSRTSEAATSGSTSGRKRTEIWLRSWRLVELMISMPSMPAIEFSRICVTCVSMISALAPR